MPWRAGSNQISLHLNELRHCNLLFKLLLCFEGGFRLGCAELLRGFWLPLLLRNNSFQVVDCSICGGLSVRLCSSTSLFCLRCFSRLFSGSCTLWSYGGRVQKLLTLHVPKGRFRGFRVDCSIVRCRNLLADYNLLLSVVVEVE